MAVHMGYSMTQKGYVLYDLETKKLFISRYVVFKENIFPFKISKSATSNVSFPASTCDWFDTSYENQSVVD